MREDVVSVVIATRNRREALLTAVESCLAQEDVDLEVQVYDDCSEDGSAEAVRERFPQAKVHRAEKHAERLKLRNMGVRRTVADYVLFLDDDCYFPCRDTLRQGLELFAQTGDTGAVCLPYVEPARAGRQNYGWCSLRRGDEVGSFAAGATLVRRSAFLAVGGFRELLVCHHEERDLALRMLDAGWRFVYAGGDPLVHCLNPKRDKSDQVKQYAANELVIWYLNCPLEVLPVRMGATVYNHLFRAFKGYPASLKISGFMLGAYMVGKYWCERDPVSMEAYRRYRELPSHGPEEFAPGAEVPRPCRLG